MGKECLERFALVHRRLFAECYQEHKPERNITEPDIHTIPEWRVFKDKQRTTKLLELANGDVGKCEQYLRLPAYEFHKLMSYHIEQAKKAKQQHDNNANGHNAKLPSAEWQTNEQDG